MILSQLRRSSFATRFLEKGVRMSPTKGTRSFRACVVSQPEKGVSKHEVVEVSSHDSLPQPLQNVNDVSVVSVAWSTLNYKDGLVLEGQPG